MTLARNEALPAEILGQVFEHAVASVRVRPEALLQVSRKWYQTAISWRYLWSFISIVVQPKLDQYDVDDNTHWHIENQPPPPTLSRVRTYLERSGDCPLTIVISCSVEGTNVQEFAKYFALLIGHGHCHLARWKALYLRLAPNHPSHRLVLEPLSLPNLVRLRIRETHVHRYWGQFFASTPQLEHLSIDRLKLCTVPSHMQSQMATLVVGERVVDFAGTILAHWVGNNLRHLTLTWAYQTTYVHYTPIHLPHLQSLEVHGATWSRVIKIMHLPSLTSLRIVDYPIVRSFHLKSYELQGERVGELFLAMMPMMKQIQELVMAAVIFDERQLHLWQAVFKACSSLQKLTLRGCGSANTVLKEDRDLCSHLNCISSEHDEDQVWV